MHDSPDKPSTEIPAGIDEEIKTPPAGEVVPDVDKPAEGEKPADGTTDAVDQEPAADAADPDDEHDKELPDWAREKLTRSNAQAAKYRTDLRALEVKFANAKTLDEFNAAVADMNKIKDENAALMRENVAQLHKLPKDLADLLKGETREELEAHAKALAKYVVVDTERELSGGLNPAPAGSGSATPGELARQYGRRRR